ncbi:MAG: hypothetical protein E7462_04845 [Ruminococcaceae bacterium]|nr:hypothetical protein [Oscillospiraceae bacterium]
MNDLAIRIGSAIVSYFSQIELDISAARLPAVLSIVGVGMLGIFTVTLVIILISTLLNKIGSK